MAEGPGTGREREMAMTRPRRAAPTAAAMRGHWLPLLLFVVCVLGGTACSDSAPERTGDGSSALVLGPPAPGIELGCPKPGDAASPFPAELALSNTPAAGTIPGAFSVSG